MKIISLIILICMTSKTFAEDKIKFNLVNVELPKAIDLYSKASGQKFIIDSNVREKITLLNQNEISLTEAFEQLSEALALNGFAINKHDDVMIVRSARSAQRDYIEVGTEKPSLKPVRLYTWIYTPKNVPARELYQSSSRELTSMYGEVSINDNANQIIFTDFTSSLNRVAEILKEVDKKLDSTTSKLAMDSKKIRAQEIANKKAKPAKVETTSDKH